MHLQSSNPSWPGFLRFTPIVTSTILLFSIITLALSAAFGKQLYEAPLDPGQINGYPNYYGAGRWPKAYFIFYSGTTPLLTTIHSTIDLLLYFNHSLHPNYALTISFIFFAGWIIQLVFWSSCDFAGLWYERSCYQMKLQPTYVGGDLVGVSEALGTTKVAFGIFLLCLYFVYIVLSTVAVHKRRMQRKAMEVGVRLVDVPK